MDTDDLINDICESGMENVQMLAEEFVEKYKVKVISDGSYDFGNLAVQFPSGRFILYHDYLEWHTEDSLLIEGFIDNERIKIERIYYENRKKEEKIQMGTSEEDFYRQIHGNHLPIQFISWKVHGTEASLPIDFSYVSGKTWDEQKRSEAMKWFDKLNRTLENTTLGI
jgi:hypothetical protein